MITWSPTNMPGVREYRSGGLVYYLTITVFHSLLEVATPLGELIRARQHPRELRPDADLVREAERLIVRDETNVRYR